MEMILPYLKAFVVGGLICVIGQLLLAKTSLTFARILVLFVVSGVVLSAIGLYGPLVDFAGAGATVLGGNGVISVLSNIMPSQTVEICDRFFRGDVAGAAKLQYEYHALITALFSEVNPIPVKAAMAAMGFCKNYLRLPLTTMAPEQEKVLLACMRAQGLLSLDRKGWITHENSIYQNARYRQ